MISVLENYGFEQNIRKQDCVEYLKTLEDESVSLVLTDPPYFIGFDGGKGWDSSWDSEDEYLAWCEEWTSEAVRVLKPGGMACSSFGAL